MYPSALLRMPAIVREYAGYNGLGHPIWSEPQITQTRLVGKRRQVRNSAGVDVISSAQATFRRDVRIGTQSRVEVDGAIYTVLEVLPSEGITMQSHIDVLLEGPEL